MDSNEDTEDESQSSLSEDFTILEDDDITEVR